MAGLFLLGNGRRIYREFLRDIQFAKAIQRTFDSTRILLVKGFIESGWGHRGVYKKG